MKNPERLDLSWNDVNINLPFDLINLEILQVSATLLEEGEFPILCSFLKKLRTFLIPDMSNTSDLSTFAHLTALEEIFVGRSLYRE